MYLFVFVFFGAMIAVSSGWFHVVSLCRAIKIIHLKNLANNAAFTCAGDMDDDDNDEQWSLSTPSKYWLSYRADGHYSWAEENQPSGETRWFPVPAGQPFGLMR